MFDYANFSSVESFQSLDFCQTSEWPGKPPLAEPVPGLTTLHFSGAIARFSTVSFAGSMGDKEEQTAGHPLSKSCGEF